MMHPAPDPQTQDLAPEIEPPRGERGIRGFYPASQRGRIAADGSFLNLVSVDHALAAAWRDPACEIMRCWRPETLRMVPPEYRKCRLHATQPLPPEDPFPLEGQELLLAERKAWASQLLKYGVPARYHNLEGLRPTPALEAALACEEEHSCKCVVLEGGVGCGKTTALYARLRALALDQVQMDLRDVIQIYTFPQLSRLLLDEDERDDTLEACCEADELLLDDLGAGYTKAAGFVVSLVEEIVIHREARLYPILATTNLEPKRFRSLFGDRVFDRLKSEWGCWLNVDRPSFRTKRRPTR